VFFLVFVADKRNLIRRVIPRVEDEMVSTLFEEANTEAEMLATAEEREREEATAVVKLL